jgi:hypothetical protein
VVEVVLRARRRKAAWCADAAIRYASMGWPVCPGAYQPSHEHHPADMQRACSCDRIGCPSPGAHPMSPAWQNLASTDPDLVTRWWRANPEATIILVTGRLFDVLDVPAQAGATALARLEQSGVPSGPVAVSVGRRMHFYVRTRGAPADESEWWSCHLDCVPEELADAGGLRWHCRDSYVIAPPSRAGGGTAARWLRSPAGHELPDGVRLLNFLADACEETR